MKICFMNVNPESVSGDFVKVLEKTLDPIKDEGTQIGFRFPKVGCNRATDFSTSYFELLNKVQVIHAIIEAEKEGFDAVVVGCFFDTGVQEAREMVDIPVVGINEFSLSLAAQMGERCAIVGLHEPKINLQLEHVMKKNSCGCNDWTKRIIPIDLPSIEWMKNGINNVEVIAAEIEKAAKIGVKYGADMIIIGCAGLGPLASLAGLKEVEGTKVPILDPVSIGLKAAEFRVKLKNSLGLPPVSRAMKYQMPRSKDYERMKQVFDL
ncbi:aspartate/glutamate racemase family protein [Brevibacillus brevis]|uniref:Aspartate/glutamate racemase family protein n=1 Tax=Brevibacillus brevis TaxID=1393 RepID=A0ABY9SXM1_BREBE|nr:aspartate/glutamate racemase family protein [Brevibacillus brevis]WNC12302.1 aspartate/glutamate racemase family protein [Brevibacillus brevis]